MRYFTSFLYKVTRTWSVFHIHSTFHSTCGPWLTHWACSSGLLHNSKVTESGGRRHGATKLIAETLPRPRSSFGFDFLIK